MKPYGQVSSTPSNLGPRRVPPCGSPECGASTSISDHPTFGSGVLDEHGFWEDPCATCARAHEAAHPGERAWPFPELKITTGKKIFVEAKDWTEDGVSAALATISYEEGWEDVGIGSYEFWGARGTDRQMSYSVEAPVPYVRVKFPLARPENTEDCDLIPDEVFVNLDRGGCDGEHRGHCDERCQEIRLHARWQLRKITDSDGRAVGIYEFISAEE